MTIYGCLDLCEVGSSRQVGKSFWKSIKMIVYQFYNNIKKNEER